MKEHAKQEVQARETYKSDLMRAKAREDGLAVQLEALQSRFDDLQAELIRFQTSAPEEVGRGIRLLP